MVGKTVRWVAGLVLTAVVVVIVGVLLVPRAFGLTPYVVTSGSMRPTFDPGAVVLTRNVPDAEIRVGDIITFQTPQDVTTHRVVGRMQVDGADGQALLFKTRGDANNARDAEPVDSRNVLGEVRYAVAGVGYVVERVTTPLGLGALAVLLGLVVFTGGHRSAQRPEASTPELRLVDTGAQS